MESKLSFCNRRGCLSFGRRKKSVCLLLAFTKQMEVNLKFERLELVLQLGTLEVVRTEHLDIIQNLDMILVIGQIKISVSISVA